MEQHAVIALSVIGVVATLCQWFAWWVKLPAIVFLLLAGLILGPLTGWLNPDSLFGDLLFPIVSLSVAIILFEGSLTLRFNQIRALQKVVRNLLTFGVLIIWAIIAIATHYLLGFTWELSLLFGALMVVTGPTVIIPMLRTVRPNANIANILRWEGIAIDPIGAILAVLVFEFILSSQGHGHISLGHTLIIFGQTLAVGFVIGVIAGYLLGLVLRHHLLPEYLHNVGTLTLVFAVFALSNYLSEESGLLTVTVMGIWLANMKNVIVEDILNFKESLSILLISGLFILLAARLDFAQFEALGIAGFILFLVIQFIARPVKVFICTAGSDLTWQERVLIGWIGPRGIVAAAVSALFALKLQDLGIEDAELLVPLAFTIIIGTVFLQGATARFIATRLGVAEPDDKGFLIIGANTVARMIAKSLNDNGYRTRLADANWTNVQAARMEGLDTYYGNAVSEHADRHLDLVGLGQMIAITPQKEFNVLAGLRYRSEFGSQHIFFLPTDKDEKESGSRTTISHDANILFEHDVTYSKLVSLVSQGATVKQTKLSENFDYSAYQEQYSNRSIPLFAIDNKNKLYFFTTDKVVEPKQDWTLVSLVQEEAEQ